MIEQFGLRVKTENKKDHKLGFLIVLPRLNTIPKSVYNPILFLEHQTSSDFCGSASVGQNEKGILEKKRVFWPALFAIAKEISGDDVNSWGLEMRDVYLAANKSVPMFEDTPQFLLDKLEQQDWDFLRDIKNYPQDFIDSGEKYRNKSFADVWHPTYDAYDTVRATLAKFEAEKRTVGFGVRFGWPLSQYILDSIPEQGFGHKMSFTGYDEEGLVCPNTYGAEAGKDGIHRMTRETVNAFAKKYGMFMGIDLEVNEAREILSRREWTLSSWYGKIGIWLRNLWK